MSNKRKSRYEKSGGLRRGRVGIYIFIVAAVMCEAVMIYSYIHSSGGAVLAAMIIVLAVMFISIAVSLSKLVRNMEQRGDAAVGKITDYNKQKEADKEKSNRVKR